MSKKGKEKNTKNKAKHTKLMNLKLVSINVVYPGASPQEMEIRRSV